jgi:ABC-type multidrug transport system fused ATPase/permease subunit
MEAQQELGLTAALRQLYGFMSPQRRGQFVAVLVLMLIGGLAEMAAIASVLPFLSLLAGEQSTPFLWIVELLADLGLGTAAERVQAAALLFMAVAVFAAVVRLLLAWSSQSFIYQLGHDIAVEINRRILLQPYSFHTQHNSSEVLASLETTQILVSGVLMQLMHGVTSAVIAGAIVSVLVSIDPFTAAAAAGGVGLIYIVISSFAARRLTRDSEASGKAYGERLQLVQESLGGIRDIIIDRSQDIYLDAFRAVDWRLAQARSRTSFISSAPRFLIEAAGMVVIAALALALSQRSGGLTAAIPVLGGMALGALRLLPFLQQLYASWTVLAGNRAVAARVLKLLQLPVSDEFDSRAAVPPLPFHGEIRFENVTFAYAGARRPALHDVDFALPSGARVALVGRSGTGKSTLADLLMGLLEPSSGRILIDGVALSSETRARWRMAIAHVPQSVFLADTSVRRNIAFGVPDQLVDAARLERAIRLAHLESVIAALPDGVDTIIGEGGIRLSGGQRQRLGLARAIYKDSQVLVLDEATNALDRETEAAILEGLNEYAGDRRTIVIITHRPSAITSSDFTVRLESGGSVRIVDGSNSGAEPRVKVAD